MMWMLVEDEVECVSVSGGVDDIVGEVRGGVRWMVWEGGNVGSIE